MGGYACWLGPKDRFGGLGGFLLIYFLVVLASDEHSGFWEVKSMMLVFNLSNCSGGCSIENLIPTGVT